MSKSVSFLLHSLFKVKKEEQLEDDTFHICESLQKQWPPWARLSSKETAQAETPSSPQFTRINEKQTGTSGED